MGTMTDVIASMLSAHIGKSMIMCRGLVNLRISDTRGQVPVDTFNVNDWKAVIKGIGGRLERTGNANAAAITTAMISELDANPSLLAMSTF